LQPVEQVVASETHLFSPSLSNEARAAGRVWTCGHSTSITESTSHPRLVYRAATFQATC
jgi:hypothetical protein